MGLYLVINQKSMKRPSEVYQLIIRILAVLALIVYILSLIGEGASLFGGASFQDVSVYLLFIVFEWCLGLWVWDDPDIALVIGFPIFIVGLLAIIYGIRKRAASQ